MHAAHDAQCYWVGLKGDCEGRYVVVQGPHFNPTPAEAPPLGLPGYPSVRRPVQSYEFAGLERIAVDEQRSVMLAQRLRGVLRRVGLLYHDIASLHMHVGHALMPEHARGRVAHVHASTSAQVRFRAALHGG